jgi:hypothetical protein
VLFRSIEAVQLETSGVKGPRLICTQAFYEGLTNKYERYIIPYDKTGNLFEILWPAFAYINGNDIDLELINQFEEFFNPAVTLWKAFNHFESGINYYNFLKLIIQSTLHYFSFDATHLEKAKRHITERLRQVDMDLKTNDLMGKYA